MDAVKKEIWRAVKGYEGLYSVSDLGRVYSRYNNKIMKESLDKYGYITVSLSIKGHCVPRKVHRLVAIAFIPNPLNKKQVNHKDLNKLNNSKSNLEWNTAQENISHAYINGIHNKRINDTSKKVDIYKEGLFVSTIKSIAETARELSIPSSTISMYLKNNRKLYGKAKGYHFEYSDHKRKLAS